MRGVNRVILVGNVGRDPEVRRSKSGDPWCTFSLATNRGVRDADGNWTTEADWHDIKAFGRTAEICSEYVRKGKAIAVEGSITYRKWQDNEGRNRYSTTILAERVQFVDKRDDHDEPRYASAAPVPLVQTPELESIPF